MQQRHTDTNGTVDFDQQLTSTVGGDYTLPSHAEQEEAEDAAEQWAWAEMGRRAWVQRAKDEPW